ncbi:MAG: hypothetical protein H0W83_07825 [Planctomycetes bacterium]|nr:hypothetical protein [Planctomycetota bacterium]
MRALLSIASALALALTCHAADERLAAGQEGKLEIPGCGFPCVISVPSDYVSGTRLPLILFMHGSGGSPTTWPFKDATGGKGSFIVGLSYGALADAGAGGIKTDPASSVAMAAFIDQVREQVDRTYGIDQKRVMLTGLSMGGWGVNFYGFQKAALGRYRGYAIIAAGARSEADLTIAKGLPVLVLNGEQDPNLPTAKAGMPLLEKAGAIAKQVIIPGQGHVPANPTMNVPLKSWLDDMDAADARGKALAAIAWRSGAFTGAPGKDSDTNAALGAFISQQAFMKDAPAGAPVLIFCRSRQEGKGGQPTAQGKDSAAVDESVFSFPAAGMTPAASRAFTCYDVDVSAIDAKQNALVNQTTAPVVILLAKDRQVAAVIKGKAKITDAALEAEMVKLVDADAAIAIAARITATAPVLKDMQAMQKKIRAKSDALVKLRDTPAKGAAAQSAKDKRVEQEEQAMKQLDEEYEALRGRLAE